MPRPHVVPIMLHRAGRVESESKKRFPHTHRAVLLLEPKWVNPLALHLPCVV